MNIASSVRMRMPTTARDEAATLARRSLCANGAAVSARGEEREESPRLHASQAVASTTCTHNSLRVSGAATSAISICGSLRANRECHERSRWRLRYS